MPSTRVELFKNKFLKGENKKDYFQKVKQARDEATKKHEDGVAKPRQQVVEACVERFRQDVDEWQGLICEDYFVFDNLSEQFENTDLDLENMEDDEWANLAKTIATEVQAILHEGGLKQCRCEFLAEDEDQGDRIVVYDLLKSIEECAAAAE